MIVALAHNTITLLMILILLKFAYGKNRKNEIDFESMNDKPVIN